MPFLFKQMRRYLVNTNGFNKYLLYALGEIILVVAGILIALSVNNSNDERKFEQELDVIYSRILSETNRNIVLADEILQIFEKEEHLFLNVINDTITPELIERNYGANLITYYLNYYIETTGYEQLKAVNVMDSLSIEIIDLYGSGIAKIELIEKAISQNSQEMLIDWRNNYPWFKDFLNSRLSSESIEYFTNSWDFKNKVAYHHILVYGNYINTLNDFKSALEKLEVKLKNRKKRMS